MLAEPRCGTHHHPVITLNDTSPSVEAHFEPTLVSLLLHVQSNSCNSALCPQRPQHTALCSRRRRSPEVSWNDSSVLRSLLSGCDRTEWALGAHDSAVSEVHKDNTQAEAQTEPDAVNADVSDDISPGNGAGVAEEGVVEAVMETVSSVGELGAIAGQSGTHPDPAEDQAAAERAKAISTVAFWVGAAVVFGVGVGLVEGAPKASEFFAGYILEQSLSVDNLLVFVIVFDYFKVPPAYQPRVLTYGIAGAIVFRGIMIGLGVATIESFSFVNLIFAAILIFSSYKLLSTSEEDESDDLSDNAIVKFCRRFIPVTSDYDENKFYTMVDGVRKATPLLLTLAVVELSDIVFAVDSIPAVFGVTRDPLIVFTSNIFAILGLRSLYVLVASSVGDLEYLQPAVALVLGFIGVKIVAEFCDFPIPTEYSLLLVGSVLGGGVALSLNKKNEEKEKE